MTSQTLYVWQHMHYIWHHIHSLWHLITLFMTSGPLYLTSRPLFQSHYTHSIDDISATLCMISLPVYQWHPIRSIYDVISTMYDITTLYVNDTTLGIYDIICPAHVITSTLSHHTTVLMMSHPLQAWHHTHCIRHHTHCIFVIKISPLISHPQHIHYMCDIICTIYNIRSTPHVITQLYLWHHNLCIWNGIQYIGNIYTIHVTSQSLFCVITPTV